MSSDHQGRPESHLYRWYIHPLTSLIVLAALSLVIAAALGRDVGTLAFFGMLDFLRGCIEQIGEGGSRSSGDPELDEG
ncbi:hypothetical protein SAMN05444374_102130 [Rhodococcoides kroppenstedtii]|uniref:Uncharacterized protein n=1 Tax=Rhodococcoides kroppenstedtii TaxID=293050 RepID=A0A1I0SQI0_9NOCA|nr:hypothetical protein SAMN05444374_102130 [Rhodococcus kroppenstedtii]